MYLASTIYMAVSPSHSQSKEYNNNNNNNKSIKSIAILFYCIIIVMYSTVQDLLQLFSFKNINFMHNKNKREAMKRK